MIGSLRETEFTPKTLKLLNQTISEEYVPDKDFDLVYIVKPCDDNPDLRISLRSISKFCTFKNIWIVGYKPSWVTGVKYIHTEQTGNKWKNSIVNYLAACNTPEISNNFVLMNDDFFAIHPIRDWKKETNKCLGTLTQKIVSLSTKKKLSRWQTAFVTGKELLQKLGCKTEYNYELHIPIIINKQLFLSMFNISAIKEFNDTPKVLHKRSIYKNLFPDQEEPKRTVDVKLDLYEDLEEWRLDLNWLSVFDDMITNTQDYPKLNKLISAMFPDKCRFEL